MQSPHQVPAARVVGKGDYLPKIRANARQADGKFCQYPCGTFSTFPCVPLTPPRYLHHLQASPQQQPPPPPHEHLCERSRCNSQEGISHESLNAVNIGTCQARTCPHVITAIAALQISHHPAALQSPTLSIPHSAKLPRAPVSIGHCRQEAGSPRLSHF